MTFFNSNYIIDKIRLFKFSDVLNPGSLGEYIRVILGFLPSSVVIPGPLNLE